MRRQASTCKGLKKRVRNLGFERVCDPRVAGKVKYPLPTLLTALVASMVTMARSLRMVEQRTEQLARKQGCWMNVEGRIADNTFGKVLPRLEVTDLMACLHRLVKAEHRRCENNTHWTADAELMEDRRRPAWSRHPSGNLVVSALRMMALCILAIARKLSRFDYTEETPSWGQVAEHCLLQLCDSNLETRAFDDV